jgi:hypothetical protein
VSDSDTTQSGNIVGGDQAGRDIHKTIVNCVPGPGCQSQIVVLSEKFRAERAGDVKFHETIEKLEHFQARVDHEPIVGVEDKLTTAGFSIQQVEFAKKTKELFAKKLVQFQLSESAQRIQALLLAELDSRFHNVIAR